MEKTGFVNEELLQNIQTLEERIIVLEKNQKCSCKEYPEYIQRKLEVLINISDATYDGKKLNLKFDHCHTGCRLISTDKYNNQKVVVQSDGNEPHEVGGPVDTEYDLHLLADQLHSHQIYWENKITKKHIQQIPLTLYEDEYYDESIPKMERYKHMHSYMISEIEIDEHDMWMSCTVAHKKAHDLSHNGSIEQIKHVIKNKNKEHMHNAKKVEIMFYRHEGSPGLFSGCWWLYSTLDLIATVAVSFIEAASAVGGKSNYCSFRSCIRFYD